MAGNIRQCLLCTVPEHHTCKVLTDQCFSHSSHLSSTLISSLLHSLAITRTSLDVPVHCTSQSAVQFLETTRHEDYCSIGPPHFGLHHFFSHQLYSIFACHWAVVCDCYRFLFFPSSSSLSVNLILAHVTSTLSSSNWQSAPLAICRFNLLLTKEDMQIRCLQEKDLFWRSTVWLVVISMFSSFCLLVSIDDYDVLHV